MLCRLPTSKQKEHLDADFSMSSDDQALQGAFRALAEGDRLRRDSDGEAAVRKFEDSLTSARKIQDPDKRARAENSAQWGLLITYNGLGQHDKAMQSLEASLRAKEISEIPEPRHANQAYMSSEFLLTSYWCA